MAALVLLAACAPQRPSPSTGVGLHVSPSGHVHPSLRTSLGPVAVSAVGRHGVIGTRIGGIGISAGL